MPSYVICPHCTFPSVVRALRRGKAQLCRQCGHGYVVSRREDRVRRLDADTQAGLLALSVRHRGEKRSSQIERDARNRPHHPERSIHLRQETRQKPKVWVIG